MTMETAQIHFRIDNPTALNVQTKYHHFMASFGYGMALVSGYGMPGIANASLMCEFSSVFLNYKDMFIEYRDTKGGICNQLTFFLCFIFFRILLFPFLNMRCFVIWHVFGKYVGWFRWTAMGLTTICSCSVTLLQFFWLRLMIRGI